MLDIILIMMWGMINYLVIDEAIESYKWKQLRKEVEEALAISRELRERSEKEIDERMKKHGMV